MLDISQVQFQKPAQPKQPKPLSAKALKKKARRERHERQREAKLEAHQAKADRLEQLSDTIAEIRMECDVYGLVLRIGYTESHGKNSAPRHWMFETQRGVRVLNWWPTSGKTWSPVNFERRVVNDVWQVIQYAARIKETMG